MSKADETRVAAKTRLFACQPEKILRKAGKRLLGHVAQPLPVAEIGARDRGDPGRGRFVVEEAGAGGLRAGRAGR